MTKKEIGMLLRSLRKTNHYSVVQLVTLLEEFDVHIAVKTYYGYEAGINTPSLNTFFALCNIYKYDILKLICEFPPVNNQEAQLIRNYHALDANGKSAINALMKYELDRTKALKFCREKVEFLQKQIMEHTENM